MNVVDRGSPVPSERADGRVFDRHNRPRRRVPRCSAHRGSGGAGELRETPERTGSTSSDSLEPIIRQALAAAGGVLTTTAGAARAGQPVTPLALDLSAAEAAINQQLAAIDRAGSSAGTSDATVLRLCAVLLRRTRDYVLAFDAPPPAALTAQQRLIVRTDQASVRTRLRTPRRRPIRQPSRSWPNCVTSGNSWALPPPIEPSGCANCDQAFAHDAPGPGASAS